LENRNSALTITRRHLLQGAAVAAWAPALGITASVPAFEAAHAQSSEPAWRPLANVSSSTVSKPKKSSTRPRWLASKAFTY